MGMRNEFNYRWENPVKIRSCEYLNNIVEQDHRRVKFRLQLMLGFRRFYNARGVIAGVELAQKIHKGQFTVQQHSVQMLLPSGVEYSPPSNDGDHKTRC